LNILVPCEVINLYSLFRNQLFIAVIPAWKYLGLFLLCPFFINAQTDLGWDGQPNNDDQIAPLGYYGDTGDMTGGYQIGDTVPDFTLYDFDGNSINLYDKLAGEKPVMLVNGSVTCLRFRNTFDPEVSGQAYTATRNFILAHQQEIEWVFVYGVEAHPTDGNCPSNCPPTITVDTTALQPLTYLERKWATKNWDDAEEFDLPFTIYPDNPDNSVYDNFFERAFGNLMINCEGIVTMRGDWAMDYIAMNVVEIENQIATWESCTPIWINDTTEEPDVDPIKVDDNGVELPGETVGMDDHWKTSLIMYPNPANQQVRFSNLPQTGVLNMTDISGRVVHSEQLNGATFNLDTSSLPQGYYIVSILTPSGSAQLKLIIQH
jgi:hypothetical protein